jgi:GNAT superfamily N-acetyltransferase
VSTATVTTRPRRADDDIDALDEGNPLAWHRLLLQGLEEQGAIELVWFVAEVDGEAVGYAALAPLPIGAGGSGLAVLNVVPAARRQGAATALRQELEKAARGLVAGVLLTHHEDAVAAEATARAWGLQESGRHHESVLDLTTIDRDAFAAHAAREGFEVRPLGDPGALDEAAWVDLHAFVQDRFKEAPDSADGGGELPIEALRVQVVEPWSLYEAYVDGERVGIALVIARPGEDAAANTFFTGVSGPVRGRGVATALKSAQALAMADAGIQRLYTQNMGGNTPILAANARLGFVRDSGYVDVLVPVPVPTS